MTADITGLLTDQELEALGRLKSGLWKIQDAIARINSLAVSTGLPLRQVSEVSVALMANDISSLAFSHELAEQRIRAAAFEAVERHAA